MEQTLILVKPDAFARGLTGEIIARFERKGLRIRELKGMTVGTELAERHYAEHAERPFFAELVEFISSGPIVAMVLEGTDAVAAARQVIGATNPLEAATGSIRGDFALEVSKNMVHGSDSPESAAREVALFFARVVSPVGRPVPPSENERRGLLVLASASPQRRALLERIGVDFTVRPQEVEELEAGEPREVVLENAWRKARAACAEDARGTVLACDTVVALGEVIYGKPPDEDAARATLRALSDATHEVLGGIVLVSGGERHTAVASTEVTFRALGEDLIDWYVARGEWRGRAGGYAIQGAGAALVRCVRGDYENVVGLSLATLLEMYPRLLGLDAGVRDCATGAPRRSAIGKRRCTKAPLSAGVRSFARVLSAI